LVKTVITVPELPVIVTVLSNVESEASNLQPAFAELVTLTGPVNVESLAEKVKAEVVSLIVTDELKLEFGVVNVPPETATVPVKVDT
jgi:hypothetical protein